MKLVGSMGMALLLLMAHTTWANPIVRLDAPSVVNLGDEFTVLVFAEGVVSPDELLAFGFRVGYPFGIVSFDSHSIVAPFHDDTPLLAGPLAGSVFPGLQGDTILLANLTFSVVGAGVARLHVRDQENAPLTTGLFTALSPERHRIDAYADVNTVIVTEPATLFLIGLSLVTLLPLRWVFTGS